MWSVASCVDRLLGWRLGRLCFWGGRGITNKSLRALMTGLPSVPCTMNQASYDRPGYPATS